MNGGAPRRPVRVRPPAVAGMFYPDDPTELRATVERYLARVPASATAGDTPPAPKALIVPHAGYVYSGPVAATAYARLAAARGTVERVVVAGPAHRVPVRGMALSSADVWETPLGAVPIDRAACESIVGLAGVDVDDRAHAPEHSLEVHLPFLQVVLGTGWSLVPIVVGHATATQVADVLDVLWDGEATRVVVSSDLSHYHDYDTATALDRRTAAAIAAGDTGVEPDQACGAYPVRGLLAAADRHGLDVEVLDLRNSGDTAGPRDRVVGYGAFALA